MMNNMPYPMPNYPPYQNPIDQKLLELEEKIFELERKQKELEKRINSIDKPKTNFLSSNVSTDQGLYMI